VGRVEAGERAVFELAELRRGGGVARGRGEIGFGAPFPWSLSASFDAVPLAALALPGGTWEGTASGGATVGGSFREPEVTARAAAEGVVVGTVPVGRAAVEAHLDGTDLAVTARTDGIQLQAQASTAGEMPFRAAAELAVDDVLRFVPGGPPAGLQARVRGKATASGVLTDLAGARAEVRLDEIRGGYADFRVDNVDPVVIAVQDRRVAVRSFALRGVNTELTLVGARDASGQLGLDARGAMDLRLLGGLLPGVADPHGQLALEAHVGGTLVDPLLVGTGTFRDAGFRMRELPVVFSELAGDVAFSQNRMLFDRLTAAVNGGRAELDGEVELVRFFPARVRVGAAVSEVPLRVPQWLPSVVSGRLQAAGSWDAMLLSGKLEVLRALYSDPVDLEKRLVEVPRRKPEPRPVDRGGEWLGFDIALVVNGDARIENDVARAGMRGELTLTGTLAAVGLVGSLTMTPGSRGTFRGNEFVLTHAVVDFTDRRRVRMSLDVHGEAQVRDYQVVMHLFGPYEAPNLQLSTVPALSQQDIVTLLSLGYTTRDTAAAGGVAGVATAAAAQALFTASGLDDQVRRIVPRSKVVRDFTVRITSAYSEGAGQVVPRAEFETKVLDERLRLRYQAPLTSARGQSAEAEMRLGARTSVQYRWDTDNPDFSSGGDHGIDLKLRWEWAD
jgi:translocation and assembly module TamB